MTRDWYRDYGKRGLDLLVAVGGSVLLSPVMAVTAALIRIDSPGPVLFLQDRAGCGGRTFRVFKFRTMVDRPRTHDREIIGRDQEVTGVGYWLRRFKIDELPQLFNVVRGEMSIVGPRPGLPVNLSECPPLQQVRLQVRPGLTGLAQTHGNIHLSWEERWQYDAEYVARLSLWLDLWLIGRTVAVVILGEDRFLRRWPEGGAAPPAETRRAA
jgi:lipopolysaccharide/colanic/teichoic acid biosynthesis glycosyltransferase